jgi:hypothetical protein
MHLYCTSTEDSCPIYTCCIHACLYWPASGPKGIIRPAPDFIRQEPCSSCSRSVHAALAQELVCLVEYARAELATALRRPRHSGVGPSVSWVDICRPTPTETLSHVPLLCLLHCHIPFVSAVVAFSSCFLLVKSVAWSIGSNLLCYSVLYHLAPTSCRLYISFPLLVACHPSPNTIFLYASTERSSYLHPSACATDT